MSREWKPGDVAIVNLRDRARASIDGGTVHVAMRDRTDSWASGTTFGRHIDDDEVLDARPLVVIDPDDREQVERLYHLYLTAGDLSTTEVQDMQAALREFANPKPPKPEEPTGLGAVVEDDRGHKFVRVAEVFDGWAKDRDWQRIGGELNAVRNFGWADLNIVRVLSDGVTP